MAIMIPDTPPQEGPGHESEGIVYEVLKHQLSDDFYVYHGLSYLDSREPAEGEADFLIMHPTFGMLVLECKGGGVERKPNGQWIRKHRGKKDKLKESPLDQAQRHIKQLSQELQRRAKEVALDLLVGQHNSLPLNFGHAVVFPLTFQEEGNLPLEANEHILFDASALEDLGARIIRAMTYWATNRQMPPMSKEDFDRFRLEVVHPPLRFAEVLGARIAADEQRFVQLSREQVDILKGFLGMRRIGVRGGAGTGKSILAIEAARLLAEAGKDVLLACFTRELSQDLQGRVDRLHGLPGKVTAGHFHSLCIQAYGKLSREVPFPRRGDAAANRQFWEEAAPMTLLEAIDAGLMDRWDAIVVDEAQDFCDAWWHVLFDGLRDRDDYDLIYFYDPSQDLFERGCPVPDVPGHYELQRNFRNTREIARIVSRLGNVKMTSHERCPQGEPPQVQRYTSTETQLRAVERLIQELVSKHHVRPDQIAILTPHSRKNSLLADRETIGGYPIADTLAERRGAIYHNSISAFKGLESHVVILADIDPDDPRCNLKTRYVGASRARHRLHVFERRDWMADA